MTLRTTIVATLGPASSTPDTIEALISAVMILENLLVIEDGIYTHDRFIDLRFLNHVEFQRQ